jgi:hypothetical protein
MIIEIIYTVSACHILEKAYFFLDLLAKGTSLEIISHMEIAQL